MQSGNDEFNMQATQKFGDIDHDIEVSVEENVLVLRVENCESFEQWTGKYDGSYIEELSHKTGNYKQFNIFCNMLESAVLKNTKSVSLDLLTYEDLKILREKKLGTISNVQRKKHKQTFDNKLQMKRYLIMTYTVEFDQIHYPLPLSYTGTGTSDPSILRQQMKDLKIENQRLRNRRDHNSDGYGNSEYEKLLEENNELKEELQTYHGQLRGVGDTGNLSKELRVLKKVVQNLETDLVKERSKHQRTMLKKKKEYDELLQYFEELKATERNFRVRCKSLTEELAMMKRKSRMSPVSAQKSKLINRSRSRERSVDRTNSGIGRNLSAQKRRPTSRSVSRDREGSLSGSSFGGRTPSPGFRRFNPSAYIKEREQRRKESEKFRKRTPSSKRNLTPKSSNYMRKPPISCSKGRINSASRTSNKNSKQRLNINERRFSNNSEDSISRLKIRKHVTSKSIKQRQSSDEEERYPKSKLKPKKKRVPLNRSYNQDTEDEEDDDHSIGIAEIDARLEALKNFMKDNVD